MPKNSKIGITSGMSGYFAVQYDIETHEPIQTGIGRYKTAKQAAIEALGWAWTDEIPLGFNPADYDLLEQAKKLKLI